MRHRKSGRKFSRTASHRKAMFSNMVTSLFRHERIQTTTPKAKELRRVADRLITLAKRGDLHARRLAARTVRDPEVLEKLFSELGPRNADRPGGYTRVIHVMNRRGDNAPISIIELVGAPEASVDVSEPDEDAVEESEAGAEA